MYVLMALLFGSLLLGVSGRWSAAVQARLVLLGVTAATLIYYVSQRAM